MTPDERSLLQQFLSDLQGSRGAAKDPEADGMIAESLRANPDGAYLLVQHALLADQALQAAQQRIEALEQTAAPTHGSPVSFLGGGQPPPPVTEAPRQDDWGSQPPPPRPQSPLAQTSGLGGFLRNAGTLAAGMAGGEFLAQGLSNLFAPRDW